MKFFKKIADFKKTAIEINIYKVYNFLFAIPKKIVPTRYRKDLVETEDKLKFANRRGWRNTNKGRSLTPKGKIDCFLIFWRKEDTSVIEVWSMKKKKNCQKNLLKNHTL